MTIPVKPGARQAKPKIAKDFQDHLAALEERGLVVRVDRPINKDTELHPLARWQFQGALSEDKRRAFLLRMWSTAMGANTTCRLWPARLPPRPRFTRWAWGSRSTTS